MRKGVPVFLVFCLFFKSTIIVCCFICNNYCIIISALLMSNSMFLPKYSSGNIKTDGIPPVSACLAFFVHLDMAALLCMRAAML